jgi:hypothetical protein
MKPGPEVKALQDRLNKMLPRIVGESPDRPVKILVQTGTPREIVNVRLWYDARGTVGVDYEPDKGLVVSRSLSELTKLPDLALADFLAKEVKRLLYPEE